MDTEPTDEQKIVEETSKLVEIVVETEAEAGASGYSVTGGGQRGIFVKDVLKDSPAAKHLSLQEGDQLLSAKVYFDNVKYEDALKILQCAEPYKVSFLLKRTISGADVSMRPRVPSVEAKAKMAKMSVKGIKPFKAKKKRGGRFGLKRLKEKHREELVIEGTPPRLDMSEVDVEFSLPKFKQRRSVKVDAGATGGAAATGKGKRRIRFPHMKTKGYAGAETGAKLERGRLEGQVNISPCEIPGAKVKTKGKGHKFGITFPKSKHTKSGSSLETGCVELKPPGVNIQPPSVEFSLSGDKDMDIEKGGVKINSPNVEFALPSGKAEGSLPAMKAKAAPEIDIKGEDAVVGKFDVDVGKRDAKLRMPKLKLPKVRLSRHSDEIDGDIKVKPKGTKVPHPDINPPKGAIKGCGDISLHGENVTKPNTDGDLSGGTTSIQLPSVDIALPKVHAKPDIDILVPGLDTRCKIPDEVEGSFKGPKISMPKIDISLPKMESDSVNIEEPEGGGKFSLPSVDISLPKADPEGGDVNMDHYVGGDGKFKMPDFDISFPKIMLPEEVNISGQEMERGLKSPKVDLTLPKSKDTTDVEGGGKFKLPSFDISLPKLKTGEVEADIKGMSKPKGKMEGNTGVKGHAEQGEKFKMPTFDFDVSLPKLKQPEGQNDAKLEMPKGKLEGDINVDGPSATEVPSVDISVTNIKLPEGDVKLPNALPKANMERDIEFDGSGVGRAKFKTPTFGISLPKMNTKVGEVEVEGYEVEGGPKFNMPSLDISLPAMKLSEGELNIEGPRAKGETFQMSSLDVSLPKIKSQEGGIDTDSTQFEVKTPQADLDLGGNKMKGGKISMPTVDISLPTGKADDEIDILGPTGKGGRFKMPAFDVSLPKMRMPEEINGLEGTSIDISLKKDKVEGDIQTKDKGGHFHMPSIDVSIPKIKSKQCNIDTERSKIKGSEIKMPTIDISPPQGTLEGDSAEGEERGGKFSPPSVDITLPAVKFPEGDLNFQGPKVKSGKFKMPKIDLSLAKGKERHGDIDVDIHPGKDGDVEIPSCDIGLPMGKVKGDINVKGPAGRTGKFKLPKFDMSLPKINLPEGDVKKPKIKGNIDMPAIDISLPQGKLEGDIEGHEGKGGNLHMPSTDITPPKIKPKDVDVNIGGPKVKGGKFKMPSYSLDISAPKMKSPEVDLTLEGPDVKEGKFNLPAADFSLSKVGSDLNIKGPDVQRRKFEIPKFDVSVPKVNHPEGDINIKGPDLKGRKIELPDIDISLPKGKSEIENERHAGKGGKFHMPSLDISLPKMKAKGPEINIEAPDIKGGKLNMPSLDVSLPKVKSPDVDLSLESPDVRGGKVNIPTVDISLPQGKVEGDLNIEGPGVKGGRFKMPKFDVSLPKVNFPEGDVELKGPDVKSGKLNMPSLDMSLPKVKSPDADISLEGPDVRGGKINFPTVDVSLPKGKVGGEINVDGPEVKGGKSKMPKFDVSLPKVSFPAADVKLKGPDIKVGKLEMPDIDISLPKGKPRGDVEIEGHAGKGGKFHMPSLDISLPKMKAEGPEINIEAPDIKGGKLNMPSLDISLPNVKSPDVDFSLESPDVKGGKVNIPTVDISLPQGKVEGDINIEGPGVKGGKFKMPKFDVSLPKVNLPKVDANLEGPDMKGGIEMPTVDISLPKGKANVDIDIDGYSGKGGKFHMPSLDISLPKIKGKGGDIDIEGPEPKGDISLPQGKVEGDLNIEDPDVKGGRFKLPKFDVSLPKVSLPEGDVKLKGPDIKGGKLNMPSLDVSLPKVKSPDANISLQGPDVRGGKINFPTVDISLPKGKVEGDINVEGPEVKGGKSKMPKFDVSLPKVSFPAGDVKLKGPDIKGGKIEMPEIDISLPKGKPEGDIEIEGHAGKGGKFHMPSLDISFPKMKAKGPEINIETPDIKGGKLNMPSLDVSLPKVKSPDVDLSLESPDVKGGKVKTNIHQPKLKDKGTDIEIHSVEGPGGSLKRPTMKLPTVDISAPKVDLDFGRAKPKGDDVKVELLKAEGGRPSSGGSFDLPDVSLKVPSFTLPRFGGKTMSGDLQISGKDISLSPTHVEGEIRAPSVEFDGEGKVKVKKSKLKMPSFGISKNNAVSCPDVDVKVKKGKVDIPKPEMHIESPDNKSKYNVKLPKFKMSSSKGQLPEGEVNTDLELDEDGKRGYHGPDVTIKLPKFSMPGFGSKEKDLVPSDYLETKPKVKMPSVELSLPTAITPETEVLLPKAEVDVSEADIRGYEGNLKIPKLPVVDVSIPKIDLDVSLPKGKHGTKIDGEGGKFKMPDIKMPNVDISLPKVKSPQIEGPEMELKGGKEKLKMRHITMPSIDMSLPKRKSGDPDISDIQLDSDGGGKFKMPSVDIALPKTKTGKIDTSVNVEGEGNKLSIPGIKLPNTDISICQEKTSKLDGADVEIEGGRKLKMPHVKMPQVDINLPKIKNAKVDRPDNMPSVDMSLPKGKTEGPDVEIEGTDGEFKMPHMKIPSVDISLPKGQIEVPAVEIEGTTREKFKLPHWKMPDVDISLLKGKTEDPGVEIRGGKGERLKMPHNEMPDLDMSEGGGEKFKLPKVDISFPKGNPLIEGPAMEIKGDGGQFKMPKVDILRPEGTCKDVQAPGLEAELTGIKIRSLDVKLPKVSEQNHDLSQVEINISTTEAGGKIKPPKVISSDLDIDITHSEPKQDTESPGEAEHKGLKLKMPTIDIKGPKGDLELDIGLHKREGKTDKKKVELPDLDLNTAGNISKVKGPKVKGTKFKIGMPKKKNGRNVKVESKICQNCGSDELGGQVEHRCMVKERFEHKVEVETHNRHSDNKGGIRATAPGVTLPSVEGSANLGASGEGSISTKEAEIKVPMIPDIEFDIGTSQDEDGDKTENRTGKSIKIPKFGVPLPSISHPEGRMNIHAPEIKYEGPKMPKVKKAVFVLLNPPQTDESAVNTCVIDNETTSEAKTEGAKVKIHKIKMKPDFGKCKDKSIAVSTEWEEEDKSMLGKMKMPQMSPGKLGSLDVKGSSSSLNGEQDVSPHKDNKGTFSGKIKLPKVELTSPYGKMAAAEEDTKMDVIMGKDPSPGLKVKSSELPFTGFNEDSFKDVVSSHARTDMLDRDSSESPSGFSMDFTSTKVQAWSEVESTSRNPEEKESSPWFKVPKFTLKPHSTGFLQITPEGSPQAQRKGEVGGEAEVSGSFCLHTSGLDLTTQEMSREHQVSSTGEGTVTMVTKTTRITRQMVYTDSHAGESSTSSTTTRQVSDFN